MEWVTLTDAVLHDKAQGLRHAHADKLMALELEHVTEGERCCDASTIAAFVVLNASLGNREALAVLGLSLPGAGPVSDEELSAALSA